MPYHSLDRFDRQSRINGWNQKKFRDASIMVIGAGALGNEIVKNLALIGIGKVLVVDSDVIEPSNLSRTTLFTERDIGKDKAGTLAAAARQLYPEINASSIKGDIHYDVGLGFYRNADLIIGAVDNLAARSHACTCAALAGKPYLDSGVSAHGGEVKWLFSGDSACFDCLLSEHDRNTIAVRYSCSGFTTDDTDNTIFPSTLAPVAIIAGIVAQEVCYFFNNIRPIIPGEAIVYNGMELSLHKTMLPRNPSCFNHIEHPYENVQKLPYRSDRITAGHIMQIAAASMKGPVSLELGRNFLESLYCANCDQYEHINNLISRISEKKQYCPVCASERQKKVITDLTEGHRFSSMSLASLGLPAGEIIIVSSPGGLAFYELTGDILPDLQTDLKN